MNVQEFELQIASMAVTYVPDEDDSVSSAVCVGSTPPVQSRSSTMGSTGRGRAVAVSDANFAIIQQTVEVSLRYAVCMFWLAAKAHCHVSRSSECCRSWNS